MQVLVCHCEEHTWCSSALSHTAAGLPLPQLLSSGKKTFLAGLPNAGVTAVSLCFLTWICLLDFADSCFERKQRCVT